MRPADPGEGQRERDESQAGPIPAPAMDSAEPAGEGDPANEAERDSDAPVEQSLSDPASDGSGGAQAQDAPAAQSAAADDPLNQAERERAEYLELAKRTKADFENYRKRAAKEAARAGERAKAGLVRELLSVVDNLERALASLEGAADEERNQTTLAEGVRLVHSELVGVLERSGVESFDPDGQAFDPTFHEALMTRREMEAEPGTVLEVLEKGYRLGESVLRPARVVVSA